MGLGNPGSEYANTRHNVGFRTVQSLALALGGRLAKPLFQPVLRGRAGTLFVALPLTYMNRSGLVMKRMLRWSRASVDELLVVCDNMDLPPGTVRIKRKGSATQHNGLSSVMDALRTGSFARLYVGIGRPDPGATVVDHVLGTPGSRESTAYERALDVACQALAELQHEPLDAVMNRVNARAAY